MPNQSTLLYVCQQILDLELKFNYILWDTVGCSQQKVRLGEYSATHFTIFLMYSVLLKAISEGTIQNNLYLNLKKSYILCIYYICTVYTYSTTTVYAYSVKIERIVLFNSGQEQSEEVKDHDHYGGGGGVAEIWQTVHRFIIRFNMDSKSKDCTSWMFKNLQNGYRKGGK